MNILSVIDRCSDFLTAAQNELGYGNEFCAEQNLVKLRELLNSQPELKDGACREHLVDLREFLKAQPELEAGGATESSIPRKE